MKSNSSAIVAMIKYDNKAEYGYKIKLDSGFEGT
jgi:hypothetical protein